ncbi:MAG: GH39 family glycosyl hydrolase, partial [Actinomycetes bacterium]
LQVYREVDGRPVHDFARVDAVYDLLLSTGLRPCVEIGFMPRDLASDPTRRVVGHVPAQRHEVVGWPARRALLLGGK